MHIVTGGAGFIGSNLVTRLNSIGIDDIIIVDNLTNGSKHKNLNSLVFNDYIDKHDFIEKLELFKKEKIEIFFHQGACTDTMQNDGRYMMSNNYKFSKELLNFCQNYNIRFIYASSASVYGTGDNGFKEEKRCENPLNIYAYSKFFFDQYVRRILPTSTSQIAGLRYFNVYGPGEAHKAKMASIILQFYKQIQEKNTIKLFKGSENFVRDFIHVNDIINIIIFFMEHPDKNGIFNCGTGSPISFTEIAEIFKRIYLNINYEYIDFPQELKYKYQTYTKADIGNLLKTGYSNDFISTNDGIKDYISILDKK